jgi:4-carboxymuconolactone decarboxylase
VHGAVNNGLSAVDIQETLLQVAIYVGMPAGLAGFRIAEKVLNDIKAEKESQ